MQEYESEDRADNARQMGPEKVDGNARLDIKTHERDKGGKETIYASISHGQRRMRRDVSPNNVKKRGHNNAKSRKDGLTRRSRTIRGAKVLIAISEAEGVLLRFHSLQLSCRGE